MKAAQAPSPVEPVAAPEASSFAAPEAPIVIVGGGPVGMRAAQILAQQGQPVTVLGDEPHQPYNRVRLTPLLGGDVQFGEITLRVPEATEGRDFQFLSGQAVVSINRETRRVITRNGAAWPYRKLILATGSRAFVPNIPGKDVQGVYTFRTADDASALLARSFSARHVAIIGGGLLGLEAARGMRRRDCQVTVLEHEGRLMPRQLDAAAGQLLEQRITAMGVAVRTGLQVAEITGTHRVDGLRLGDGSHLDCDTVVICTGVRARIDLAQAAGLAFNRGILVDDQMQTSDPDIFAVGECAQHAGRMYGLVGPGYAQADVASEVILGRPATFNGHANATKLKVIGADVFSVGDVEQLEARASVKSHVWENDGMYRRIFIEGGKLVAAIAVGPWEQASRVQDAVQARVSVYPWMLYRFRRQGQFWAEQDPEVADLPDGATICNCTAVTCGQLRAAIAAQAPDPGGLDPAALDATALGARTGAGTVCGTCKPLLAELLDAGAPPKPARFSGPLLWLSGGAAVLACLPVVLGYVPLPTSYDADSLRSWAWRDNIVKQWSGFILLGILAAAMLIGLRKRLRLTDRLGLGSFDAWRLVHIGIGLLAAAGFFAHTGFRLGANMNFLLGASFLATVMLGALSGLATGGDHSLRAARIGTARRPARRWPTWAHIIAIWPLPVLVLVHVLTVYAF